MASKFQLPKQYNVMRGKAMGESWLIAPAFPTLALKLRSELMKTRAPERGLLGVDLHPQHNMSGNAPVRPT